jgi:hypothetical protein
VTKSASPRGWSDATAQTHAAKSMLAPHGARVERIDPRRRGCRTVVTSEAPSCSRKSVGHRFKLTVIAQRSGRESEPDRENGIVLVPYATS